jgi:hypothetical protein
MSSSTLSPHLRRVVTLVLAVPACYFAYAAGVALGPNPGTFSQPHNQPINRSMGWS